jgi:hypothetical protein
MALLPNFSKLFRRWSNVDRYELIDGALIRHGGWFSRDVVPIKQVKAWRIIHEMIFDFVILELSDEMQWTWFDYDNDLISTLRTEIPDLEIQK